MKTQNASQLSKCVDSSRRGISLVVVLVATATLCIGAALLTKGIGCKGDAEFPAHPIVDTAWTVDPVSHLTPEGEGEAEGAVPVEVVESKTEQFLEKSTEGMTPEERSLYIDEFRTLASDFALSNEFGIGPVTLYDQDVRVFPSRNLYDKAKTLPNGFEGKMLDGATLAIMPVPMIKFDEVERALKSARTPNAGELEAYGIEQAEASSWKSLSLEVHMINDHIVSETRRQLHDQYGKAFKIDQLNIRIVPLCGLGMTFKVPGREEPVFAPFKIRLGWQPRKADVRILVPSDSLTSAENFLEEFEAKLSFSAIGMIPTYEYAAVVSEIIKSMSNQEIIDVLATAYDVELTGGSEGGSAGLSYLDKNFQVGASGSASRHRQSIRVEPILLTGEQLRTLLHVVVTHQTSYRSGFGNEATLENALRQVTETGLARQVSEDEAKKEAKLWDAFEQRNNVIENRAGGGADGSGGSKAPAASATGGAGKDETAPNINITGGNSTADVKPGKPPISEQIFRLSTSDSRVTNLSEAIQITLKYSLYESKDIHSLLVEQHIPAKVERVASKTATIQFAGSEVETSHRTPDTIHADGKFVHNPGSGNPDHGARRGQLEISIEAATAGERSEEATVAVKVDVVGIKAGSNIASPHLFSGKQTVTLKLPENFVGFDTRGQFKGTLQTEVPFDIDENWVGDTIGVNLFPVQVGPVDGSSVQLKQSTVCPFASLKYKYRGKTTKWGRTRWNERCCKDHDATAGNIRARLHIELPIVVETDPERVDIRPLTVPLAKPMAVKSIPNVL